MPSATFMGRSSWKFQGSFIMVKTEFIFFCFALVACTGKLQKKTVRLGHKYQPGIITRFWCFPPALKPGFPVKTRLFWPKIEKCNFWTPKVRWTLFRTLIRSVIENYTTSCNLKSYKYNTKRFISNFVFSRRFRVKKPCFVVVVKKDLLVKPGNKNFRLKMEMPNRAYIGRKKTIKKSYKK